jgi:hypothetical protein
MNYFPLFLRSIGLLGYVPIGFHLQLISKYQLCVARSLASGRPNQIRALVLVAGGE